MRNTLPQLAVHKGLRGDILLELKRSQPRTATELGATLGVSANAIRHHLKELVTESLITYGREQRGVGAPTYAYRLSPEGRSEEHTSELQSRLHLVCRLLLEKKKIQSRHAPITSRLRAETHTEAT